MSLGYTSVPKTEKKTKEKKRGTGKKGRERGEKGGKMVMCSNVAYKPSSSVTKYIYFKSVTGIHFPLILCH